MLAVRFKAHLRTVFVPMTRQFWVLQRWYGGFDPFCWSLRCFPCLLRGSFGALLTQHERRRVVMIMARVVEACAREMMVGAINSTRDRRVLTVLVSNTLELVGCFLLNRLMLESAAIADEAVRPVSG